jgi:type IV pilus assembly protein PilW
MSTPSQPVAGTDRRVQWPVGPQRGLTLVELMIALALGLLLVAGVGAVYLGSNQTYRTAQAGARIQETGRYALDVIGRSLRQAGFKSVPSNPAAAMPTFSGTPIRGVNSACPTASPVTDILTAQFDGVAGEQDCQATNITAGQIVQHTFFIQDATLRCNAVQNATAPTPPTACPATNSGVQLLENVEDLQVLYGIDTNSDQSADSYTATPTDWTKVVTARVCVLVRSDSDGIVPANAKYLDCSGALGTAATAATPDTRLRRAFVATFTLRNRVSVIPGV